MVETSVLRTSLLAVLFVAGCSKSTGGPGETSETAAEANASSASEAAAAATSASSGESTGGTTTSSGAEPTGGTTTSTGASEPTSGTSAADSTTGAPVIPCHLNFTKVGCEAGVDCVFIPGHEAVVRDGECVSGELGEVGFCYFMEGGGPTAPGGYFEVETGRVFVFPNTPVPPPEGWQKCTCDAPSPEACQCVGGCSGTSTSG